MIHYHKNPRQITRKQMAALGVTMDDLGDLSGIMHDLDTDEILTGNQRIEVIPGALSGLVQPTITERFDPPLLDGTAALGYFEYKGKRFNYRAVKGWDDEKRERAVIVANKAGGTWDFDILANEFETEKLLEYGFEERELGIYHLEDEKWEGMPEFEQENKEGNLLTFHFPTLEDKQNFINLTGLNISIKTNSFWYPERPIELTDQLGTKAGLVYHNEP